MHFTRLLKELRRLPAGWQFALATLAGLIAGLGFAPVESVAPTILGCTLALLMLAYAPRPFLTGFGFGFGQFAIGLRWIATAFTYQAAMPASMGWVAVVGLSLYLALFPAVAGWFARRLASGVVGISIAFAGIFVLLEMLRGLLFTGFAWNPLGAPWLQLKGVALMAAGIGANGLSGLMLLSSGSLAALVAGREERGRGALVAIFPALLVIGLVLPRVMPALSAPAGPEMLLVQPNISQAEKNSGNSADAAIEKQVLLTRAAVSRHPDARMVIWPEAAVEYALNEEPGLANVLGGLLRPGMHLLTGSIAVERAADGNVIGIRNSLYALDAAGRIGMRYDKSHLVPGGEYLPLRAIAEPLGLSRLVPGDMDFLPGGGPHSFRLSAIPAFGPAICYEIIFPAAIIDRHDRPAWILTVSNDAWFGPSGPPQHHAQARLRAIEEGLPVVRVTPTGITSVIDRRGGVTAILPAHREGVLAARLPEAGPPTPFARLGLLAPGFIGLLLAATAWLLCRRKI